jgi:hypothetical protein
MADMAIGRCRVLLRRKWSLRTIRSRWSPRTIRSKVLVIPEGELDENEVARRNCLWENSDENECSTELSLGRAGTSSAEMEGSIELSPLSFTPE